MIVTNCSPYVRLCKLLILYVAKVVLHTQMYCMCSMFFTENIKYVFTGATFSGIIVCNRAWHDMHYTDKAVDLDEL